MPEAQLQPAPGWGVIHLDDFDAPSEPPTEAVRLGVRTWWRQFLLRRRPPSEHSDQPPELTSAPANLLNYLLPSPDWNRISSEMLAAALSCHDFETTPCAVVVTPPYCTPHDGILAWAEQVDAIILPAPTADQLLSNPHRWFDAWPADKAVPLVIPALERCYLRHHRGLGLARQLIDNLHHEHRRALVVCDSWAWAFLTYTCPTNLLAARPWTAAPLEANDLNTLFGGFMRQTGSEGVAFRRVDSGKIALQMVEADGAEYSDEFLTHLAAHSRGNPVVAWDIWRRSLLVSAHLAEAEIDEDALARGSLDHRRQIWVQRWSRLDKPQLTFPVDDCTAFVLHALLLHKGLAVDLLYQLLPAFPLEVARTLRRLHSAGVIHEVEGEWLVTPAAYPEVRHGLAQQGFLVDAL